MNAEIFIYIIFGIIVVYDILLGVFKKDYITTVFRKWYTSKPIVPFMVGVVFIGHFQTLVEVSCMPIFLAMSILYLAWWLIMSLTSINIGRKFYDINCKYFFIPMVLGTIAGIFWR